MRGIFGGAVAGLVGTAAMTVAGKVEQGLTGRPNSYVPAKTLARGCSDSIASAAITTWC